MMGNSPTAMAESTASSFQIQNHVNSMSMITLTIIIAIVQAAQLQADSILLKRSMSQTS